MSAFEEKWLWLDPFAVEANSRTHRLQPGAVLLAEDIVEYVEKYGLLFDPQEFIKPHLKGASYSMSPHPTDAWHFVDGDSDGTGRPLREERLNIAEDSHGRHYIVPRNSLVFIRLKEELRVPFYMIGRHNLKIRYAYRGLLLGTGPQVDPGFVQRLFIPLHNFTTEDAKVYIDESFVSIDFVRTAPLRFAAGEPPPVTREELYFKYKETKFFLPADKLGRTTLRDYLKDATPQSVLHEVGRNYQRMKEQIEIMQAELKQAQERLVVAGEKLRADTESKMVEFRRDLENWHNTLKEGRNAFEERVEMRLAHEAKESSEKSEKLEARIDKQLTEMKGRLRWDLIAGAAIVIAVVGIAYSTASFVRDVLGDIPNTGPLEVQLGEMRLAQLEELNTLRAQLVVLEEKLSKKDAVDRMPLGVPTGIAPSNGVGIASPSKSEPAPQPSAVQPSPDAPRQGAHKTESKAGDLPHQPDVGTKTETPPDI